MCTFAYALTVSVWYPLRFIRAKRTQKATTVEGGVEDGISLGGLRD